MQFSAYRGAWADVLWVLYDALGPQHAGFFRISAVQCSISHEPLIVKKHLRSAGQIDSRESERGRGMLSGYIYFRFFEKKRKRVQYHSFSISIIDVQDWITGLNRSTAYASVTSRQLMDRRARGDDTQS